MTNLFAPQILKQLRAEHATIRDKRSADRIKAVLLIADGYSYSDVAKILLLDDETIRRHVNNFQLKGLSGLLELGYKGGLPYLRRNQEQQLETMLRAKIYTSSNQIVELIEQTFGVTYTPAGAIELLYRIGFAYKKPTPLPGKLDLSAQEQFVEEYETFKKRRGKNDKIYFLDAVHPQHNATPNYGWLPKGEVIPLRTNSGRQRVNIHGALDPELLDVIVREDKTINSESTIALLRQIEASNPLASKILIYSDNARYYHSREVRNYVEKSAKIEFRFLPPYSPNLNPIERLWKIFKEKIIYNNYYDKFQDFKQACWGFFIHIDQYYEEIANRITPEFQMIQL